MSKRSAIALAPAGRIAKWVFLAAWIVVIILAGPLAGKLTGAEKNDAQSWLPAQAESTKVIAIESKIVSPNVLPAVIVYDRPGPLTSADTAKAKADLTAFTRIEGAVASQAAGPIVSPKGHAIETVIPVNLGSNGWSQASPTADKMLAIARSGSNGMSVHIAGPLGNAADSAKSFQGIDSTLLYATLAVVVVILLITYRSPLLWLLPVISAGIALTAAQAVIYELAIHAGLTVTGQSAGILDVLIFGAGTDYALLLIARYREELRRHEDRHAAMAIAIRRAGPAIVASGGTVILSLLTLLVAELNSTKGLGPVLAIGVFVGLISMMTLLPALLVICGRWVFWPVRPGYGSKEPTATGVWARVGRAIAVRPRLTWVATAAILGALALGMLGLKANGLTTAQSYTNTPQSVTGAQILGRYFPAGAGEPVVVTGAPDAGPRLAAALKAVPGIASVAPPVQAGGHSLIEGTLVSAPDSQAAYNTIDQARTALHAVPGGQALVGGQSATMLDIERASVHDRNLVIPLILAVVLIILMLLLRAISGPLVLIATVVLSFATALGVSSLVFTHLFGFAGADASMPLFVFVFLVALGIDYNIFLMTRVREEAQKFGPKTGALTGLAATGGVITSAGLVLAGTFAALGTLPLVSFAEIGFAVALGVLLDTIIVRSVLVTALNLDLGRWMWWPGRLAREPRAEEDKMFAPEPAGARQ